MRLKEDARGVSRSLTGTPSRAGPMRRVLRHNGPFKCLISGTFFLLFYLSRSLATIPALLQCIKEDVTSLRSSFHAAYSRGFPPFIVHEGNKARGSRSPSWRTRLGHEPRVFSQLLNTITSFPPTNPICNSHYPLMLTQSADPPGKPDKEHGSKFLPIKRENIGPRPALVSASRWEAAAAGRSGRGARCT